MSKQFNDIIEAMNHNDLPPYPYAYPPRSTHRSPLNPLSEFEIWKEEDKFTNDIINLYLHFPFCAYRCGFCNLYTVANKNIELQDRYIKALCKQLESYDGIIQKRELKTIFLGGGTPMLISKENFLKIIDTLNTVVPDWRNTVEEFCIEASPDSIVAASKTGMLDTLISNGIDRINLGIQSFQKNDIAEMGRGYGNDVNIQAIEILKEYGVANISTDLIAGFNGQTKEMWLHSVEQLTKLAPQTISIYCVRIRPDSQFGRSGKYNNSYDFYYDWYEEAREIMLNAGYIQETNVRFKIPKKGGYIQQYYQFICKPILGVGAGARSYTSVADYIVGGSAKPNVHEIEEYMDKVEAGAPLLRSLYALDDEERARRKLVLNLYEFNERQFQDEFGSRFNWIYKEKFAFLMNEGLLDRAGDVYFLTKQGIKYRDIISWSFFSERVRELDKEFYSELVAVK